MRKNCKYIIIIFSVAILFIFGRRFLDEKYFKNEQVVEKEDIQDVEKEDVIVQEPIDVVEEIIPEDYFAGVEDKFNVNENVKKLINTYLNRYFKGIYTLENVDFSDLFIDEYQLTLNNCAVNLLIESRKKAPYDYRMSKAQYAYYISEYSSNNDEFKLTIRENDDYTFKSLPNTQSGCYDILIEMIVKKVNDEYKFTKLEKRQDFFVMFIDAKPKSVEDLNNLYAKYLSAKDLENKNNETLFKQASENAYVAPYSYDHPYDRTKAQAYTYLYIRERNPQYQDFSSWGGNCQSFASQMLLVGGIPMDNVGTYENQWKYYGASLDISENKSGRSYSWAVVDDFYTYTKAKINETGLVSHTDCNIYYAEPGDIIQVGFNNYHGHTTVVSDVVDGQILLNSNTLNMKNFPLEAYAYNTKRLIKILGYND